MKRTYNYKSMMAKFPDDVSEVVRGCLTDRFFVLKGFIAYADEMGWEFDERIIKDTLELVIIEQLLCAINERKCASKKPKTRRNK